MTSKRVLALKGNSMKLDGGAMFGNAPRALWSKWMNPDAHNRIEIGSRSLLIETGSHKILFETGVGAYLSSEMKKRYHINEDHHVLLESLNKKGLHHKDITHIVLSHLHFDHIGGLLKAWDADSKSISMLFPNAQIYVGLRNFERSVSPHIRDRASFIDGFATLLEQSGRLNLVKEKDQLILDDIQISFIESHGHTPGMILSYIEGLHSSILFVGDIAPGHAWINLPITMGYDRYPEKLIDEKQQILKKYSQENPWIFYTHDAQYAASKLKFNDAKKRFEPINLVTDMEFSDSFSNSIL
jgi:glyoxylase-like metal-dependent hydrolase (beta-lactamase superfamily II)